MRKGYAVPVEIFFLLAIVLAIVGFAIFLFLKRTGLI